MKIVMICEFFNEELEYQENLLAKYYIKNGHEVTVITSTFDSVFDYYEDRHDNRRPGRVFEYGGAKIIKLPFAYNIVNKLRAYTPIKKILEDERPDLIYLHDIMLNIPEAVAYVRKNPSCKMIMDYHADYSNSGKNWVSIKILHGVIRKWFLDQARPYLEKIFPIVPAGGVFLHEVYKVPKSDLELLPLGTDVDLGAEISARGAGPALREALGISPADFVIFTGGKLTALKKTEHLIEAVNLLGRSDVHLIVVGDVSADEQSYKELLLRAAAGSPNIHFRGWANKVQVYEHLDMADIAVFPASQSVLWQQAMGMGLPLIVSDRSDLAKGHQDVSYLNEHGNIIILDHTRPLAEQIRGHLADLIENRGQLAAMAQGAFRATDELLNWDKLILKTLRFNDPSLIEADGR